jgi:hypothetical protein
MHRRVNRDLLSNTAELDNGNLRRETIPSHIRITRLRRFNLRSKALRTVFLHFKSLDDLMD